MPKLWYFQCVVTREPFYRFSMGPTNAARYRLDVWDPEVRASVFPGWGREAVIGLAKNCVPAATPGRTVQVSVQVQTQKGCETHFQASHPWRTYARVYVSSVNVACLRTDTPFRCATGLRHVPLCTYYNNLTLLPTAQDDL